MTYHEKQPFSLALLRGQGSENVAALVRQILHAPEARQQGELVCQPLSEQAGEPLAVLTGGAGGGELLRRASLAIVNLDDEYSAAARKSAACPTYTYSENKEFADLTAENLRLRDRALEFEAVTGTEILRVRLPEGGGVDLYEALGALACVSALGIPLKKAAGGNCLTLTLS